MKKLLIKQCPDGMRWYAKFVGQTVPFLRDVGNEYKSREPEGYVNFVQYADAEIVDVIDSEVEALIKYSLFDWIYPTHLVDAPEFLKSEHTLTEMHVDSLNILEVGMELENVFDCTIEDEDLFSFETVGDFLAYAEKHNLKIK